MYNKLGFYIKINYTFKIQIFLVFYLNALICYLSYSHFVFRQRKSNLWKWFNFRTVLYIKYRCMHMNCTKGKIKKKFPFDTQCHFLLAIFRNAFNNSILTACLVIQLTYYYFNSILSLTTCHKLSLLEINKMVAIVGIHLNWELWNWVMGLLSFVAFCVFSQCTGILLRMWDITDWFRLVFEG